MRTAGAKRPAVSAVCAVMTTVLAIGPVAVLAQNAGNNASNPTKNIPIHGVATTDVNGNPVPTTQFEGTFDIDHFEQAGDQILAVGRLSGTLGDRRVENYPAALPVQLPGNGGRGPQGGFGGKTGALVPHRDTIPATFAPGSTTSGLPVVKAQSCQVLNLVLGPLDLNLLGLVVHLDTVHLNITAQGGSGNLLGNLLCAVANLLNPGGGALDQIAALLNQILAVLNGL